jgi:preprotein translocase subunit YajC
MSYLLDLSVGAIIGIIMFVLIKSLGKTATENMEITDGMQKQYIISFISGLCLLCLAFTAFNYSGKLDNKSMKYGSMLAGLILVINTIIFNWNSMANNTRSLLIAICLGLMVWYAYSGKSKTKSKKKKNSSKSKGNKKTKDKKS